MKRIVLIMFVIGLFISVTANEIGKPFIQMGHHAAAPTAIAIGKSGKYLLSGAGNSELVLWNLRTGQQIRTFQGHKALINTVAISNDEKFALSGSSDKTLKLWNLQTGEMINSIKAHNGDYGVKSLVFTKDSNVAVSGGDKTVKVWNLQSGKLLKTFEHTSDIQSIAVSANGAFVLSGCMNGELKLWNLKTGKLVHTYHQDAWINSLAITPDGKKIVSGDFHGLVKVFDVQTGQELFSQKYAYIEAVTISPSSNFALITSQDKVMRQLDLNSYKVMQTIKAPMGWFAEIAITPDETSVVAIQSSRQLGLWSLQTAKEIRTFTQKGSSGPLYLLPQTKSTIIVDTEEGFKLWDIQTAQQTRIIKKSTMYQGPMAISRNGKFAFYSGPKKALALWDMESGTELNHLKDNESVYAVAMNENGTIAASGGRSNKVKLWNPKTGKNILTLKKDKELTTCIAITPDDKSVLTDGGYRDNRILQWSLSAGKVVRVLKGHKKDINTIIISKDGKKAFSGSLDGTTIVWSLQTGKSIRTLPTHNKWRSVMLALSPDERVLLTSSGDKIVNVWDIESGKKIKQIQANTACYNAIFSQDGKYIVALTGDGFVRYFDYKTEKELVKTMTFADGEWLSITSEGYFNASKNGAKYLSVLTAPMSVTGVDAYYERFYRPDIVKLALQSKQIDIAVKMEDIKTPPEVEIVKTATSTTDESIHVTLKITDQGGGIGDIRLYRNGTAIQLDGSRGVKRKKQSDGSLYKTYTIKLENGLNELTAIAFDEKNLGRSDYALHQVKAKLKNSRPSIYALVIGIKEYRNPRLNLMYTVDDAKLFATHLQQYAKGLFDNIDITLLTSKEDTTKERITQEIEKMHSVNPNDLFVFYVASHGTVDDGEYFLLTSNVGSTSTKKLKQDALSQDLIKELISNVPTSKKMIILDTCNSQALGDSLQVAMMTRGMSESTAMKVLSRAVGSTILSASTSAQEALEGYKGHGLFTYVLANGLKGAADSNKDGFVKTTELADYIDDNVPELAEKVFGREQFPIVNPSGQAFPITKVR